MSVLPAVLLGKAIFGITRLFKIGGGSAAPGLYALKLNPNLVKTLASNIPKNIVITGTNGKTTTARLISHFAKASGLKVIRNHTGSNLERGIASSLISRYSLYPKPNNNPDLGIWELDEAAFNLIAPKINPDVIVFLNVFRDQLDRYGEIDSVVDKWSETLKTIDSKTKILINGDDASLNKLQEVFKGKVEKFGVEKFKITGESVKQAPKQGNLDFEAKNIKLNGLKSTSFQLSIVHCQLSITLPLPGIYHIYDFLAAFALSQTLSLGVKIVLSSLKNFSPAFGRVEKLDFGYIFLIKNPAGATQVFETITPQLKKNDRLLLALNDKLADGRDISWIWDAEFENLKSQISNLKCIVSGTRAYDLANRLKYAGFDPKNIHVEESLKKALQEAKKDLKNRLFILPTYTALLEFQGILTKSGIKKNYWEEV